MADFKTEILNNVFVIKMGTTFSGADAAKFTAESKGWVMNPADVYVVDFTETTGLDRNAYQAMIHLRGVLKGDNKLLFSVNLKTALLQKVKEDGVDQAFGPVANLDEAIHKAEVVKRARTMVDVQFINPFLVATKKTLEVQANTPVTPLKPFIKKGQMESMTIAGVLSCQTAKVNATISLCFSTPVFLKIYENMFGEVVADLSSEVEDAAGELLNIIYGVAKVELNKKGYEFKKAIPTVLTGEKLKIRQGSSVPTVVLPFQTETGNFQIEIESEQA